MRPEALRLRTRDGERVLIITWPDLFPIPGDPEYPAYLFDSGGEYLGAFSLHAGNRMIIVDVAIGHIAGHPGDVLRIDVGNIMLKMHPVEERHYYTVGNDGLVRVRSGDVSR